MNSYTANSYIEPHTHTANNDELQCTCALHMTNEFLVVENEKATHGKMLGDLSRHLFSRTGSCIKNVRGTCSK